MDRKSGWIIGIIILAVLIRLIFLFKDSMLWWDATVYIGIAKYIFSAGKIGLWEYNRPLLWPVVLGLGWKLGFNLVLFGKILGILFSAGIIFFAFEISRRIFSLKIALFSAILLAADPLLFQFTNILYNEIPAIFFGILSVYLFIVYRENKKPWLLVFSGVFSACAFLTRFPTGLVFGAIFLFLLIELLIIFIKKKKFYFRQIAVITSAFVITTLPYFIFNYLFYNGDFLRPLTGAVKIINDILITAPELNTKWYYYFPALFHNSFIFIFSVLGFIMLIYLLIKKFKFDSRLLLILLILLPFIYYQTVAFKELRYAIAYIPFLYIVAVYGLYQIGRTRIPKIIVILILISAFCASAYSCCESVKFLPEQPEELDGYYNYFSADEYDGKVVLSTTPYILANSDIKLVDLYAAGARTIDADLENSLYKHLPSYVVFSASDVPCSDDLCLKKRAKALEMLKQRFENVYCKNFSGNEYYIFKTGLEKRNTAQMIMFRMDDVGEPRNFEAVERINQMFIDELVPANWLVIPMRFENNLTQEQKEYLVETYNLGWFYIIQHGYWHETDLAKNNTEFKGLDYDVQYQEINEGKELLEKSFNQEINSFAPPYNSADENTINALKEMGFASYLTAGWDTTEIEGINRYNTDIQMITDWTPPYPIRSFDELKSEFDSLVNKNLVIIEIHHHRFYKESDFETLKKFIEYIKTKEVRFVYLYEIDKNELN